MYSHSEALSKGYLLKQYKTIDVLGLGGFGITYRAYDPDLDEEVAIKEYLPADLAQRHGYSTVTARSQSLQKDFEWGLSRFLDEARALAKFKHNHIVRVKQFFKLNSTGYMVMDYEKGETLDAVLKRVTSLDEQNTKEILLPILDGLKLVHEQRFLHRDIKPSNIIIREREGSPVLIDFGAARQTIGPEKRAMTTVLTPGYAPLEQYSPDDEQGPWSDLYAIGAVAYKCLTGEKPLDATVRVRRDTLVPVSVAAKSKVSGQFAKAIEWALCVKESDRPQSADELITAFTSGTSDDTVITAATSGTNDDTVITTMTSGTSDDTVITAMTSGTSDDNLLSHYKGKGHRDVDLGGAEPKAVGLSRAPAKGTTAREGRNQSVSSRGNSPDAASALDNGDSVSTALGAVTGDEASGTAPVGELDDATTVVGFPDRVSGSELNVADVIKPNKSGTLQVASPPRGHILDPKPAPLPHPRRPNRLMLASLAGAAVVVLIGVALFAGMPTPTQKPEDAPDREAWEQANRESAISGFETYLQSHPEGSYVRNAQDRIKTIRGEIDAAWKSAQSTDTATAYDEFLEKYRKNNILVAEAVEARERAKLEEDEWQRTQDQQTISAYQQYLYAVPTGKHRPDAEQRLPSLWVEAEIKDDADGVSAVGATVIAPCQTYLINYPDGRHFKACQQRIAELRQLAAQVRTYQQMLMDLGLYTGPANGTLGNATSASIKTFQAASGLPQTATFDPPTMAAIDKALADVGALYRQAREKRTKRDYQAILEKYPNSRYSREVGERISQCRDESRAAAPKVTTITREVKERNGNQERACAAAKTNVEDQAQKACTTGGGRALGPVIAQTRLDPDITAFERIFSGYSCIGRVELTCQTSGPMVSVEVCP